MIMKRVLAAIGVAMLSISVSAVEPDRYDGPIIDMHMHAVSLSLGEDGKPPASGCFGDPCHPIRTRATSDDEVLEITLEEMDRNNIMLGLLSGTLEDVYRWKSVAPDRFIASPHIPFPGKPSVRQLREEYASGRLRAMGEIGAQYRGLSPDHPSLEPYFSLAVEFDLPVLIHTLGNGGPRSTFRVAAGNPVLLEEVLVRHPDLRLYVENCGFPFSSEMMAMMYQYRKLHCDVSTIIWMFHRQAALDHLERLIRAGLGKRIMFGSDQALWPESISMAVETIQSAEFLSPEQRADIFYGNAARFLRLTDAQIAAHHAD
jgi:predicted TIM-barrel fold metal-dependent hydrolase